MNSIRSENERAMPLSQFAQLSAQFAQIAEAYAKARQENKDLKE